MQRKDAFCYGKDNIYSSWGYSIAFVGLQISSTVVELVLVGKQLVRPRDSDVVAGDVVKIDGDARCLEYVGRAFRHFSLPERETTFYNIIVIVFVTRTLVGVFSAEIGGGFLQLFRGPFPGLYRVGLLIETNEGFILIQQMFNAPFVSLTFFVRNKLMLVQVNYEGRHMMVRIQPPEVWDFDFRDVI